jgi:hypothetical protein
MIIMRVSKAIIGRKLRKWYALPPSRRPLPMGAESLVPNQVASAGEKNEDKRFYVIWREYPGSGFFSNVFHVLCHLDKADALGMEPVVDFENFVTLYNEEEELLGTKNAWEYYYEPTSRVSLEDVYDSRHVFLCDGKYPSGYPLDAACQARLRTVVDRFIRIRPDIEQSVQEWITGFGARTLGVHFRGQDQNRTQRHRYGPTERQMVDVTREALSEGDFERIFVVTEDQRYLDLLRREFGSMVIATDSYRTSGENAYRTFPRPLHRYLLGREVLVDALLLSRCDSLVASGSNVSEFAKLVNGGRFETVYQVWNGVNSRNPLVAFYSFGVRKHLPPRLGGLPGVVWKGGTTVSSPSHF